MLTTSLSKSSLAAHINRTLVSQLQCCCNDLQVDTDVKLRKTSISHMDDIPPLGIFVRKMHNSASEPSSNTVSTELLSPTVASA